MKALSFSALLERATYSDARRITSYIESPSLNAIASIASTVAVPIFLLGSLIILLSRSESLDVFIT